MSRAVAHWVRKGGFRRPITWRSSTAVGTGRGDEEAVHLALLEARARLWADLWERAERVPALELELRRAGRRAARVRRENRRLRAERAALEQKIIRLRDRLERCGQPVH